ncbi:MAG: NAD+ synthase [Alphaproteobacteria bacterium]
MQKNIKIAIAQKNFHLGNIKKNLAQIKDTRKIAVEKGADLIVFPELALCGYPPEDLVKRQSFLKLINKAVLELAEITKDGKTAILVGAPLLKEGKCYNGAVLLDEGRIVSEIMKYELPNYSVFDEVRVFTKGPLQRIPVFLRGVRLGIMICEDLWFSEVSKVLKENGSEILISINGSPFEMDKIAKRKEKAKQRILETGLPMMYANLVGGQDELVFDGASFVMNADQKIAVQLSEFVEELYITDWNFDNKTKKWFCEESRRSSLLDDNANVYQAMMMGLADYVNKNGFKGVVIGMSGGIDSALTAAVAVDALGADRVKLVMMPSPYTSQQSLDDAAFASKLLGTKIDTIAITDAMNVFEKMMSPLFGDLPHDITEENIQARSRGLVLMAISNKFGYMVLSTGNKSEMSVGYATLYGDMCGGYSVLKDVYKTKVFELSKWRNENYMSNFLGSKGEVVPESIIVRPPSAELRDNQLDQDSLPPYEILDDVLNMLIEKEMGIWQIINLGYKEEMVKNIWKLLKRAEYKRRQAPPGVKITSCSFGKERRYPITNAFEGD